MQIHELPEITTIASGGYLATDNGTQTTKIDYDKLAKAIIEQYSGSTLAGSAQSVQAALNGVKADSVLTRGTTETVTESTNLNDYVTPGTYFFNSSTKAVNAPGNSGYFRLVVTAPAGAVGGTNRVRYQEAVTTEGKVYTRRLNSSDGGQAWVAQAWAETPTRAEVDALNSKTDGIKNDNLIMNTAGTYTKTLDLRTINLVTVGKLNTRNNSYSGMYLVIPHQTASSILTIAESSALSSITIDAGTLSITTNTSYVIASITRLTNMA